MKKIKRLLCILCVLSMITSLPVVAADITIGNESFQSMTEFEISTGEEKEVIYEIDPNCINTIETAGTNQARVIIGEDNREPIDFADGYPSRCIGLVKTSFENDKGAYGTGFVVGSDLVLTSAHVVMSKKYGKPINISFTPGLNFDGTCFFEEPYISASAINAYCPTNWSKDFDDNYDWCLLKLSKPLGNKTNSLVCFAEDNLKGRKVTITGYAKDYMYPSGAQQCSAEGTITYSDAYMIRYNVDVLDGQSGAPVIEANVIGSSIVFKVLGINKGENDGLIKYNIGIRINSTITNLINQYTS